MSKIRWENLASFRIWFLAILVAAFPAYFAGKLAPVLGTIVLFGVVGLVLIAAALPGSLVLYCPYCRKRVKMGGTVCHHCGRDVTT